MSPALESGGVRLSPPRSANLAWSTELVWARLAGLFDSPRACSLALHAALCCAIFFLSAGRSEAQSTPAVVSSAPPQLTSVSSESGRDPVLRLTQWQGRGESAILDWVLANSGSLKGETLHGEFRVAYTITPAEGWWEKTGNGKLTWRDAPANQFHLRVFVADAGDGRLMPAFSVAATLLDTNRNEHTLPIAFGWYPLINAFGGNFSVADGAYRLRVRIAVPERLDRQPALTDEQMALGEGLARIIVAEFPPVTITQNDLMLVPLATEAASAKEAALLKPSNEALSASITALWQQSTMGEEKAEGNYFVAYALEPASSAALARLRRNGPLGVGKENARLYVLVRDSRTGRLIPFLSAQSSVETPGELHDRGSLAPMRHPWLNLYGRYLRLDRKGSYRLRVRLEPPDFRRWGRHSERFALPAEVQFGDVSFKPEDKKAQRSATGEHSAARAGPEIGSAR